MLRERLFARWYDRLVRGYEERFAEEKRRLFAPLRGVGVEIGAGTGTNLALLPEDARWIGIEPNPHMHRFARAKAEELGREVEILGDAAERLPLADASVDFALSTLVLCTVRDPAAAVAEVRRVLRPGGRFVFWEHVAAPPGTWANRLQRWLTPLWRIPACGCHLDRDLGAVLRGAGFERVEIETFRVPRDVAPPWIAPHVRGTAIR